MNVYLIETLTGDEDDVQAQWLLGWLYWHRYQVLPEGQGREDLDASIEMLTPCFILGARELPEQLLPALGEKAALTAKTWLGQTLRRLDADWIAPPGVRELRELTRYRAKLVGLRTSCKDQVHAVLGKLSVPVTCSDIFGVAGLAWLDGLSLPQPYAGKVTSLRHLVGELTAEITMLSEVTADLLAGDRGYRVIQQLPGIGPVLAAVITAEIGDVHRFQNAGQLCSWAGLTPRHRESDTKVARGHVTKQGSRMLRWAVIEAVERVPRESVIGSVKEAITGRRGKEARNIVKVAAARRLLTLVFYGLRDGQILCLSRSPDQPPVTQPPARAV